MNENKTNINWYPGHMAKTKRLISENLNFIDVVYEVIDARIPISSKIVDIDSYIKTKPRILIMTKYDLCDKSETNKIIKYYESKGYFVLTYDLEKNPSMKSLISATKKIMEKANEKRINRGLKEKKIHALIVGVPNVGKSTLINRLALKKVANVGNKPGITKNLNWIRVNSEIELLDTPGILWPKLDNEITAFNLAAFTAIKEEVLPIDEVVEYIIKKLYLLYPNILKEKYNVISIEEDFEKILEIIGKKRGCLIKGGLVDYDKVRMLVLNDIKQGSIKGITFDRI